MTTVDVNFPSLDLGLELNERDVMRYVARQIAKRHKRNLNRGVDAYGAPLKKGKDGGRALYDSGQLIRSIKGYPSKNEEDRWEAVVFATGERSDLGAKLRERNAGLLAVQIYGQQTESKRPRNPNMMALSPVLEAVGLKAFLQKVRKDLDSGRASLTRGSRSALTGLAGTALRRVA